jgi:hypothetical protein
LCIGISGLSGTGTTMNNIGISLKNLSFIYVFKLFDWNADLFAMGMPKPWEGFYA